MPLPEGAYQEALQGNKYHPPMYIVRNERSGELTVLHLESTIDTEATFTQGWMGSQEAPAPMRTCPLGRPERQSALPCAGARRNGCLLPRCMSACFTATWMLACWR